MEWKTYQLEDTTWVGPIKYSTLNEAETAAAEWSLNSVIVEIDEQDQE